MPGKAFTFLLLLFWEGHFLLLLLLLLHHEWTSNVEREMRNRWAEQTMKIRKILGKSERGVHVAANTWQGVTLSSYPFRNQIRSTYQWKIYHLVLNNTRQHSIRSQIAHNLHSAMPQLLTFLEGFCASTYCFFFVLFVEQRIDKAVDSSWVGYCVDILWVRSRVLI